MPLLVQHQKSNKHCPCPSCNPSDGQEALLEAHLPPINKYSCPECKQRFAQERSLETHQRRSLHAYCYDCGISSPTRELHAQHMQSHAPVSAMMQPSATQFRCCDCERDFKNEGALADHLRDSKLHVLGKGGKKKKNKKKKTEKQEEGNPRTKCTKCGRTFKIRGALGRHLTSVRHNPLSNIKCVADAECKKQFNCPSAQLHHLESGTCVSGTTKTKLNAAIAANDTGRIITSVGAKVQWLLEDNQSGTSTSQNRSPILTPTSTEFLDSYPPSAILTPVSSPSTSMNFNSVLTIRPHARSGYQKCPLCPPSCTRTFKRSALQQHLSSSVHAQVLTSLPLLLPNEISFHCPRALIGEETKEKAVMQFSTVSGLAQHLESGACDGGKTTFRRAVEYVQEEMKGMGFAGLKLLR